MASFHVFPRLRLGLVLLFVPFIHACCDLDDPISFSRMCTNRTVRADTPLLVKSINYTKYIDTFSSDPIGNPWNAVTLFLAKDITPPDCEETECALTGPVCRLIECIPLVQDPNAATNDGKTIITNFLVEIPGDAGPDGPRYNLAATFFNTQNFGFAIPYVMNNSTDDNISNSSLHYANNWGEFNVTNTKPVPGTFQDGFDAGWPAYLAAPPCPAYGCARICVNELYPKAVDTMDDLIPVKQCIDACPGMDTYINYCTDLGGQAQNLSQFGDKTGLGDSWKDFVPDGCAYYEGGAFPKAAASLSASLSSASASAAATRSSAAASATSTSQGNTLRAKTSWTGSPFRALALPVAIMFLLTTAWR